MLLVATVLLFSVTGCGTEVVEGNSVNNENEGIHSEETEIEIPVLDSIEYWDVVQEEIISMLNRNGLYVSAINSSYPAVLYEVEPGVQADDGKIIAAGLSQEQYEELYECVKKELHIVLDKYELAKPKSALHACDSIVGIFFFNWYIDEQKVSNRTFSRQVASYELDLLEYYHEYEENGYIYKEGFSASLWGKYPVYIP